MACVIAMRGMPLNLWGMVLNCCAAFVTFDALIDGVAALWRQAHHEAGAAITAADNSDFLFAGWSRDRHRLEAYFMSNYAPNGTPAAAFELRAIESGLVTPAVSVDDLDEDASDFLLEVGRRQHRQFGAAVSGFLQETVIRRDSIEQRILERWEAA